MSHCKSTKYYRSTIYTYSVSKQPPSWVRHIFLKDSQELHTPYLFRSTVTNFLFYIHIKNIRWVLVILSTGYTTKFHVIQAQLTVAVPPPPYHHPPLP